MKCDSMFALGQFSFTGRERVEPLLDSMAGSHGHAHALLKSGLLLLALNGLFLFLILATAPPLPLSCFMVLAAPVLSVLVIDLLHGRLLVSAEEVVRTSPFPFLRWRMERGRIAAVRYVVRQKSGEYLTFEDEAGTTRGSWVSPSLRATFIHLVPKSQRWEW